MAETTDQYRTRINQLNASIKNEPYIEKMRSDIAEGVSKTGNRQADIEDQFQEVIDNTTGKDVIAAPELIAARNGKPNLKTRIDDLENETDRQLAQTEQEVNAQFAQKVGGGKLASMGDMGQDVKEALTGGSVAVVGRNTVTTETIVDKQVTSEKTDFVEKEYEIKDVVVVKDRYAFTTGKIADPLDGVIKDNPSYTMSSKISINSDDQLFVYNTDGSSSSNTASSILYPFAFYDDTDTFISGIPQGTFGTVDVFQGKYGKFVSIPEKTALVAISVGTTALSNRHYLKVDRDYSLKIPKLIIDKNSEENNGNIVVNFGDSIFENGFDTGTDITSFMSERTGFTGVNVGFGGTQLTTHTGYWQYFSFHNLVDAVVSGDFTPQQNAMRDYAGFPSSFQATLTRLMNTDFSKVTHVTVAYSTNDFAFSKPIDNISEKYDLLTIKGSMRYSVKKLTEKYPHLKILLLTPIYRTWLDTDKVTVLYDSDTHIVNGIKMTDYVNAIKEVGEELKNPVLDNYFKLGFNEYNLKYYFGKTDGTIDGTHPNEIGRKRQGNKLGSALLSEF